MDRYEHIRDRLSRKRLDGLLVSDMLNIRYLTGFTGSSAVLFIGIESILFFTDFRYKYECEEQLKHEEVVIVKSDYFKGIKKKLKSIGVNTLGFEYGAPYHVFEKMKKEFELKALKELVERMRMIKNKKPFKMHFFLLVVISTLPVKFHPQISQISADYSNSRPQTNHTTLNSSNHPIHLIPNT